MRRIEILVSPSGETKLQTLGFQGVACKEASQLVEKALGKVVSDQPTSEMTLPSLPASIRMENQE